MVADQWKKRLRAINNIDCPLDPHGLKKKKKQGLARYNLKLRSNVSLVWDDKKRQTCQKMREDFLRNFCQKGQDQMILSINYWGRKIFTSEINFLSGKSSIA
ncbi:hypothetical protein KY290_029592 [Solanum tuberosum]|uniref:Uncharacterized protein n=1 Tax=Solanum tuberosum TaxID=4113 RepID=A0ABQ7UL62_SOLTU|nr:hypothetical protein KY289_028787 [Solanum tuberosum]KAH0663662.1 hypothetical protein KY284_028593 [Solanum tuberosum]KAH0667440.1 hypothetical protein KY285_028646 [Solanum tuberosum]KAH0750360.1 hypothetical protein KY290_029592 [Solanum tuberosum]